MPNENPPALIANLRAELARRGLRQGHLSSVWGISEMGVSRRMNGQTPITTEELTKAAASFGLEPVDLLAEHRPEHVTPPTPA
jgi:transcriptional regulator with XRE-family HTH domain